MLGKFWRTWRTRRWWIRWTAYVVVPILLFYVVEDFRGWRAWKTHKRMLEEHGETLDVRQFQREPIPEAENFAATPLVADYIARRGEGFNFDLTELPDFSYPPEQPAGIRYHGRHLAQQWRLEGHFPSVTLTRKEAAEKVLERFAEWDSQADEMRAASDRPDWLTPENWVTDGVAAESFHHTLINYYTRFLKVRAVARLELGRPVQAADDIITILEVVSHLEGSGPILNQLVAFTLLGLSEQPIWEGLRGRHWDDEQLIRLAAAIGQLDPVGSHIESLRMERALGAKVLTDLAQGPFERYDAHRDMSGYTVFDYLSLGGYISNLDWLTPVYESLDRFFFSVTPNGWLYQNAVNTCRLTDSLVIGSLPPEERLRIFSATTPSVTKRNGPYTFFVHQIGGTYNNLGQAALRAEANRRLMLIAIALERFRLANGAYPENLTELIPEFLAAIPADPFDASGGPIRLRWHEDGTPWLYSLSVNETDDGGRPSRRYRLEGDLAWYYSRPAGFSDTDYETR